MCGKGAVLFALLAAFVVSGAASVPERITPADSEDRNVLQQLLLRKDKGSPPGARDITLLSGRTARRTHLSDDERETMTRQIVSAISELMNSECMSDRDYQGWVDFGRRDADMNQR